MVMLAAMTVSSPLQARRFVRARRLGPAVPTPPGYRVHLLKQGSFPRQWLDMMTRHKAQNQSAASREDLSCPWYRMRRDIQSSMTAEKLIGKVETLLRDVPYISDSLHGRRDLWLTPREFLKSGGDCEDFAIARYLLLRSAGIPAENLAVVVCFDRMSANAAHAITICEIYGKIYIYDNQSDGPVTDWPLDRYRPLYAVNEKLWALYVKKDAFS